jgi:hypothetical protein
VSGEREPRRDQLSGNDWLQLAGGGVLVYSLLSTVGPGLLGPEYLFFFALAWAALTAAHLALRHWWRNSFALSFVAAAVLAAVAINRYRWGIQHDMHRWTFLALMTALGCSSFFLRASHLTSTDDGRSGGSGDRCGGYVSSCGSSSSTSSSCSSSGGGCGGGGGGCGGCGGGG